MNLREQTIKLKMSRAPKCWLCPGRGAWKLAYNHNIPSFVFCVAGSKITCIFTCTHGCCNTQCWDTDYANTTTRMQKLSCKNGCCVYAQIVVEFHFNLMWKLDKLTAVFDTRKWASLTSAAHFVRISVMAQHVTGNNATNLTMKLWINLYGENDNKTLGDVDTVTCPNSSELQELRVVVLLVIGIIGALIVGALLFCMFYKNERILQTIPGTKEYKRRREEPEYYFPIPQLGAVKLVASQGKSVALLAHAGLAETGLLKGIKKKKAANTDKKDLKVPTTDDVNDGAKSDGSSFYESDGLDDHDTSGQTFPAGGDRQVKNKNKKSGGKRVKRLRKKNQFSTTVFTKGKLFDHTASTGRGLTLRNRAGTDVWANFLSPESCGEKGSVAANSPDTKRYGGGVWNALGTSSELWTLLLPGDCTECLLEFQQWWMGTTCKTVKFGPTLAKLVPLPTVQNFGPMPTCWWTTKPVYLVLFSSGCFHERCEDFSSHSLRPGTNIMMNMRHP